MGSKDSNRKGKARAAQGSTGAEETGARAGSGASGEGSSSKTQRRPQQHPHHRNGGKPHRAQPGLAGQQAHRRKAHARRAAPPDDAAALPPALPGLNKLKAAIRQTKRLLARADLNPETRQEAERKLVALEEDVEAKEAENAAREVGLKNRRLIFFDSIKATRKIKTLLKSRAQARKALEGEEEAKDEAAKEKLETVEAQLNHFRVMLNYTLHWPALERYSRFYKTEPDYDPSKPRTRSAHDDEDDDDDEDEQESEEEEEEDSDSGDENAAGPKAGGTLAKKAKAATAAAAGGGPSKKHLRRIAFAREHRAWVEKAMASGEISGEPEVEREGSAGAGAGAPSRTATAAAHARTQARRNGKRRREEGEENDDHGSGAKSKMAGDHKSKKAKKQKSGKKGPQQASGDEEAASAAATASGGIQDDDFFDI
ncbi:18S rRNA maturation protein [Tilletia horrida]|nr:18S rRNA maturation protein [Tilletia horrida]